MSFVAKVLVRHKLRLLSRRSRFHRMHFEGAADGADGGATADRAAHGGVDDAVQSDCTAANRQPTTFVILEVPDEAGPHPFMERR
jgi:hypothetical protein